MRGGKPGANQGMEVLVYEDLHSLNRNIHDALLTLQRLEKRPGVRRALLRMCQAELQEIRALVSQEILEGLQTAEAKNAARYNRARGIWEQRLKGAVH
jgi:hypothetical protein